MTTFGQSAPFADVEAEFGFTPDKVAEVAREVAGRAAGNSSTT
jgi:transketolase